MMEAWPLQREYRLSPQQRWPSLVQCIPARQYFERVFQDAFDSLALPLTPPPRGREINLAIAACVISRQAELWTLNDADFGVR